MVTNIYDNTKCTIKPCGNEDFYDKIKEIIGIDYKKKKSAPKRKENL